MNRPNIIFILADDLGWRDLSAEGSSLYESPNIDRIASEGMRFTQGYAACQVCSPSRASILTGKVPPRHGITDWIGAASGEAWRERERHNKLLPPKYEHGLRHDEITFAEVLRQAGYRTFFAGKWHLGDEGTDPEDFGFEINKGGDKGGVDAGSGCASEFLGRMGRGRCQPPLPRPDPLRGQPGWQMNAVGPGVGRQRCIGSDEKQDLSAAALGRKPQGQYPATGRTVVSEHHAASGGEPTHGCHRVRQPGGVGQQQQRGQLRARTRPRRSRPLTERLRGVQQLRPVGHGETKARVLLPGKTGRKPKAITRGVGAYAPAPPTVPAFAPVRGRCRPTR